MADEVNVRKVLLEHCHSGMQVANDIFSKSKSLIVPQGTILDDFSITRMAKFGITTVDIVHHPPLVAAPAPNAFEKVYARQIDKIKHTFESLENGNLLRMEEIRATVSDLVESDIGNRDILHTLNSLRSIDEYTYTHSLNVGILAMMLARWAGLPEVQAKQICYAGVLHDIGKSRIPTRILQKPGKLTPDEFKTIKHHPVAGYDILKMTQVLAEDILQGVLLHHERMDGRGYPLGLKDEKIHQYARIVAIADVFDAMVSDRCYHAKESPFYVLDYFGTQCLGHLDARFMDIFIKRMSIYFLGERVRLSDGSEAEVVFIDPQRLNKPIVRTADRLVDLAMDMGLAISGATPT